MLERLWRRILRRPRLSLWAIPAFLLWLLSLPHRLVIAARRSFAKPVITPRAATICVGNISVGGTGKTPIVELLGRFLLAEGIRVGVVSSGYGRQSSRSFLAAGYQVQNMSTSVTGDEVKLLADCLPEAVFSVDRVKANAAQRLDESGQVDAIIVDDGFQHFRLARDLDLVTYDAAIKKRLLKPFPYGVLREPVSALSRADVVVITRSNFARDIGRLQKRLRRINPDADHYTAQFVSSEIVGQDRRLPVKYLEDKSVFLFAGIGNFKPLRKQVAALCADLDQALELSDHQQYDARVLRRIKRLADRHDSDLLLTTHKDWVKLPDFAFGREIYYLAQSIDLDPGEEKLVQRLVEKLNLEHRDH